MLLNECWPTKEYTTKCDAIQISGYVAFYNKSALQNAGKFSTVILPGSFESLLKGCLVAKMFFGDQFYKGIEIASTSTGNLRFDEDETGLLFEADLRQLSDEQIVCVVNHQVLIDPVYSVVESSWLKDVAMKTCLQKIYKIDLQAIFLNPSV